MAEASVKIWPSKPSDVPARSGSMAVLLSLGRLLSVLCMRSMYTFCEMPYLTVATRIVQSLTPFFFPCPLHNLTPC